LECSDVAKASWIVSNTGRWRVQNGFPRWRVETRKICKKTQILFLQEIASVGRATAKPTASWINDGFSFADFKGKKKLSGLSRRNPIFLKIGFLKGQNIPIILIRTITRQYSHQVHILTTHQFAE